MAEFIAKQHSSRNGTTQPVAYTGTAAPSTNAFGSGTYQVRIVANSNCHYLIAGTPVATTNDAFLAALTVEYVTVSPGQKISAIQAATNGLVTATAGTLWVTELS